MKKSKRNKKSNSWKIKQHRDPYFKKSKTLGYRSRASFKLIELNKKYRDGLEFISSSLFKEVFYELTGNICECFLLGKDYYYKKTLLPNDEFIAHVNINNKLHNSINNAKQWINTLKNDNNKMNILIN